MIPIPEPKAIRALPVIKPGEADQVREKRRNQLQLTAARNQKMKITCPHCHKPITDPVPKPKPKPKPAPPKPSLIVVSQFSAFVHCLEDNEPDASMKAKLFHFMMRIDGIKKQLIARTELTSLIRLYGVEHRIKL